MATLRPNNIDWDKPEYQNALKVVIKYEIQTLLERLSQTGEETVLLTANTTDLCVGHLASEKGKRFLNTNEVGEMKNKFLYFCTVEGADSSASETELKFTVLPQNSYTEARGRRGRPRGSGTGRGRKRAAQIQGVYTTCQMMAGQGQGDVGHRLAMPQQSGDFGASANAEMLTKFSNSKALTNMKPGEKRQQTFTAEEIQDMIVSAESKRRKVEAEKHCPMKQTQVPKSADKNKITTQKIDNLPQNKQHVFLSDDESNDYYGSQGHHDPRSSHDDLALGIKDPRFTQGTAEFQKFLEQYKEEVHKKYVEEESEFDEDYEEDEMQGYMIGNKLEKGEIPQTGHYNNGAFAASGQLLAQTYQPHYTPSQFQRQFQNFQKNNQNQVFQTPQTLKDQPKPETNEFDPNLEIKEEVESEGYGDNIPTSSAKTEKDPKSGDSKPQLFQSVTSKGTQKQEDKNVKKPVISGTEGAPEIKEEPDPHDLEYKQSADSSTSGLKQQADSSNQKVQSSSQKSQNQQPDTTQQNKGQKSTSPRPVVSGERPKTQDYSEADVSAKLEMLSAKMSWVVEYPKNFKPGQQQQPSSYLHDEEEEEEDYPEDYDDEEDNEDHYDDEDEGLDESDLERLAANKRFGAGQGHMGPTPFHGPHHGQDQGHFEDYDDEDYDEEELEHLGEDDEEYEEEYGELDSEDERALREMGQLGGHQGAQARAMLGRLQQGSMKLPPPGGTGQENFLKKSQISQEQFNQRNTAFSKTETSKMESFILMGAMAKCLVCNKLIRKNDMIQHNMIHIHEDQGEEEDVDEIQEEEDEMSGDVEQMHEHINEMHEGQHELQEDLQEMQEDELEPIEEEMHGEMHEMMGDSGEHGDLGGSDEGAEIHDNDLTAEKRTAETLPPNTCEVCLKSFKDKYRLLKHVKIHDPKDIKCELCDKTFRLRSYLTKHQRNMHPNAVSQRGKETGEIFSCGICQQNFHNQQEIDQHMGTHHK